MPSSYTGNPNATQTPSAAPGPGVAPIISIPLGTEAPTIESIMQAMKAPVDFISYLTLRVPLPLGDGSDGTATLDGVSTPPGLTALGSVYVATRDLFFDTLTINSGCSLVMAGFRLYVRSTLTVNGTIQVDGAPGNRPGAGTGGGSGGILGATGNGGAGGGIGGTGSNAPSVTAGLGGSGGTGGAGNGGFTPGTSSLTAPTATQGSIRVTQSLLTGLLFGASGTVAVNGGAGGGGGGGAGVTNAGGGGGGGGGVLLIAARQFYVGASGVLSAQGGAGCAGTGTSTAASGSGGGGGGGAVILVYQSLVSGSLAPSSVIDVSAGAGGVGGNANGTAGSAGHSYIVAAV